MSQTSFQKFQGAQGSALISVIVCAILSIVAINFVWIRAVGIAIYARVKRATSGPTREQIFFRTHLGLYLVSLLLGNLMSSVGYAINIDWVILGGVREDVLCSTQGALSQIGDTASAYFTAAVAVHTFCTLALRSRLPHWLAYVAIVVGWILVLAGGIIPATLSLSTGSVYGTDGSVCSISLRYPKVQTLLHLLPIFFASLVSAVFYSLIFLILRGTLTIKGGLKFTLDPIKRWNSQIGTAEYHKFIGAIAESMLWYPIVYIFLLLPHVIVCLLETSGMAAPFAFRVAAIACSALNGVANVLLFYNTLRVMGPAFANAQENTDDPEKSFGTRENEIERSPVDVAPPVSSVLATRSFPPPRSMPSHSRDGSVSTTSSTRHLLAPSHGRSGSSVASSQRSISPIPEVERSPSVTSNRSLGLPAPRRQGKSPVIRRPTITIEVPSHDDDEIDVLTPVNLKTPEPGAATSRRARDSFMKMYSTQSAAIYEEKAQRLTYADEIRSAGNPRMFHSVSPSYSSSSSDFSSSSGISDDNDEVPLSPYMGDLVRRTSQVESVRSAGHQRSASERPTGGMSALAVATLKSANAQRNKSYRRRSRSMENLKASKSAKPVATRPATPLTPRTVSAYSTESIEGALSPLSSRYTSTPRLQQGPSRTPTIQMTPDGRSYF
ncbi:hypothetical protein QCA50_006145 [Cerrena zonata]|uniref:G-protein coupled receptors family 1 profile domain-containing protein n=1 Tax=Cerrena zonata TaxID=2478898 RepID=A0AAW0GEV0_9APHY